MTQSTVWTLVKKMLNAAKCRPKNGSDFTQSGMRTALRRRDLAAGSGNGRSDEESVEIGGTPLRDDGSEDVFSPRQSRGRNQWSARNGRRPVPKGPGRRPSETDRPRPDSRRERGR